MLLMEIMFHTLEVSIKELESRVKPGFRLFPYVDGIEVKAHKVENHQIYHLTVLGIS